MSFYLPWKFYRQKDAVATNITTIFVVKNQVGTVETKSPQASENLYITQI